MAKILKSWLTIAHTTSLAEVRTRAKRVFQQSHKFQGSKGIMKTTKSLVVFGLLSVIGAALTACGGGGGGSSTSGNTQTTTPSAQQQSPEGVWLGQATYTTNAAHPSISMFDKDGNYAVLVSGDSTYINLANIYYGAGITSNTAGWTSKAGLNLTSNHLYLSPVPYFFNLDSAVATGTATSKTKLNGTITASSTTGGSSTFGTFTGTSYQSAYDTTPSLTGLAGTYKSTQLFSPQSSGMTVDPTFTVTVSSMGAITGSYYSGACGLSGQLSLGADATKSIYSASINALPCEAATSFPNGMATLITLPGDTKPSLVLAAKRNSGGVFPYANGIAFVAKKQ